VTGQPVVAPQELRVFYRIGAPRSRFEPDPQPKGLLPDVSRRADCPPNVDTPSNGGFKLASFYNDGEGIHLNTVA